MKTYLFIVMLACSVCRLSADYIIWTAPQPAGKTLQLNNAGNVTNYFELWRYTAATGMELITRWDVYLNRPASTVNNYQFTSTISHYSTTATYSGNAYQLTISNLPAGEYLFSIGDGGGYPTTNWYGAWNGSTGGIGWQSASPMGAFTYWVYGGFPIPVPDVSRFNLSLY